MRPALVVALVTLAACAERSPPVKPQAAPQRCPNIEADIKAMEPEVNTVHFVLHVDAPACKKHPEPRVLDLEVDGKVVREVKIPCSGPDDAGVVTIMMPDPGIDVEPFVVEAGHHAFRVIDPVTHDEDVEMATIPHVELEGNGFTIGNYFEVVEMDGFFRMRGPVAMRMPGL